jgi:hypothetical protein
MAYDDNPLSGRSRAIYAQVALKEAVNAAVATGVDIISADFETLYGYLNDLLIAKVEEGAASAPAPQVNIHTTAANVTAPSEPTNLGDLADGAYTLEVLKQTGPVPGWLIEQAQAKGVTKVWDNRKEAQGTKKPWFRSAGGEGDPIPFWPPKG